MVILGGRGSHGGVEFMAYFGGGDSSDARGKREMPWGIVEMPRGKRQKPRGIRLAVMLGWGSDCPCMCTTQVLSSVC